MDLQALTDFNLVATHGGFARAGRTSGRPKATLSRKVSELEKSLGVRLIERGTRMLWLTPEGEALHERTRGPLSDITEAGLAVGSHASVPRGRLRVSAPIVFAHVALPRMAAAFARAHPQVELEIVAEDRKADPIEDNYDLVIRIDPSPDDRLVGRRIMQDDRILIARPGIGLPLRGGANGEPDRVDAVVLARTAPGTIWRIRSGSAIRSIEPAPRLRLSSFLMIPEAVAAGAGVALVPDLMASADVASGRFVCLGVDDGPKVEIWALQNSRRLSSTKVRLFLAALHEAFGPSSGASS